MKEKFTKKRIKQYVKDLPLDSELKRRIIMTTSCRDCDYIPKIENCGEIFVEKNITYQYMHNGIKIPEGCYHGRGITEIIKLLNGHHEPQEEKIFYEILKYIPSNGLMIELGSHWSYYSMWFQKNILQAKNYMIEPDPYNLQVGKINFLLNNMVGHFFNAFISDKSSNMEEFHCESDDKRRLIQKICVDDFIQDNIIERVDLLLADIQGYEYQMLLGAEQSIKNKKIRFIFISTHHKLISNDPIIHFRCIEFIKKYNGHIIASHTIAESFSGDGLIVASFFEEDRNINPIIISKNVYTNSLFGDKDHHLNEERKRKLNYDLFKLFRTYKIFISINFILKLIFNKIKSYLSKL